MQLDDKKMSNLRKGFFQAPKNQEAGAQQQCQETIRPSKTTHTAAIPASEEKPRKQVKSVLHQEVSEFNPSGQMSMNQLVKVVLSLKEKVRKLRKENEKLTEQTQHRLQDTIDLRMANQEKELTTL